MKPKSISILIIFTWLLILFTLCASPPETITISAEDNTETSILHVKDTLNILLPANPTTGYSWQLANGDTTILTLLEKQYLNHRVKPKRVGSGGTRKLIFEARRKGNTSLKLTYIQTFQPNPQPARVFSLKVTVR